MNRPVLLFRRRVRPAACAFALLLTASVAQAQGLPSSRTGALVPQGNSAATEDATSLLVNPAGIAFVEGLELSLGGTSRIGLFDGKSSSAAVDGLLALNLMDGVAVGFASGLFLADTATPFAWTSGSFAVGASRAVSVGATLHALSALSGVMGPKFNVDLGFQLRPMRYVAFGGTIENLGAQDLFLTSARLGVAVRPFWEPLTLGADVRVVSGNKSIIDNRAWLNAQLEPSANARIELHGLALGLSATAKNIGRVAVAPLSLEVAASAEVNTEHLGAALVGGVAGLLGTRQDAIAGARLRASSAAWESIVPGGGEWVSMTLAGDGAPPTDASGIVEELFDDTPDAKAILATLANMAEDKNVEGLVVYLRGLSFGWARAAELRMALAKLKTNGKKVVVHMNGGDDIDVFVASVADQVYLTPAGGLDLNGLRGEMLYVADTLAKIGIRADAVHAGKYKSAPRTFTATEPNAEELEVQNAILDGAFATLVSGIAQGRKLKEDDVKATIDLGGLTAARALEKRIVDLLCYDDEVEDKLAAFAGKKVHLKEHYLDREERSLAWESPPTIAIVPVVGSISMGGGGGGFSPFGESTAGAKSIVEALEHATNDSDVKAIVLRVDSPGGDALASDLIWRAVMKAREKKPVVASMGDLAASGGYYVASAAPVIFAEPDTLTGSIGVFGLFFEGEELLDKVGAHVFPVERGALPGPSNMRPLSEAERAAIQFQVDATYDRFLDAILEGRGKAAGLTREQLRELAEGRVWTGAQALERKLVDRNGGLMDAIDLAREKAGLLPHDEVALSVLTGDDPLGLPGLMGVARVLAGTEQHAALTAAVRLLLGDPARASFYLAHERRPLAMEPASVKVR